MFARVLWPLVIVAALVGTASADKAKIAVLGLEVAGAIDADSTSHGRLLTDMFRGKVGGNARFELAPDTMKDLLDEKVANDCNNEGVDCMAKIGAKLKAQVLVFGKIEKRPKDGKDGYQLSMKSLDVGAKVVKEWSDWVPLTDFIDGGLDRRVQQGFDTLTRDADVGTNTNTTTDTNTTVTGTANPIVAGPKKPGGFPWKVTAYTATALAMTSFGAFIYTGPIKTKGLEDQCHPTPGGDLGSASSYDPANGGSFGNKSAAQCAKGPKFATMSKVTGIAAAALGGFALFAYYEGFVAHKKESANGPTVGRSTRKKKHIAVTPVLSPDGAGATVRFDW